MGTISATGQITVLSDYGLWAQEHGVPDGQAYEVDLQGLPHLLLYAFDLTPNSQGSLPIESRIGIGGLPEVVILPPASGMRHEVTIEYTESLTEDFQPLTEPQPVTLKKGDISPLVVPYPEGETGTGFFRLKAQ